MELVLKPKYASQELYKILAAEFGHKMFKYDNEIVTFDEYFSRYFDFPPYPNNPGWGTFDDDALDHAICRIEDDLAQLNK